MNIQNRIDCIASLALVMALTNIGCGASEAEAIEFGETEEALSAPLSIDPTLAVPEGNRLALVLSAKGTQIYVCAVSTTGFAWTLKAPDAKLYDDRGRQVGTHYAGPTWEYKDGSKVVGTRLAGVTPDATAIPWLLLQAKEHAGSGKLSEVTYIQRLNTVAGLAPAASTCSAEAEGTLEPVEYEAKYYYYVTAPLCH